MDRDPLSFDKGKVCRSRDPNDEIIDSELLRDLTISLSGEDGFLMALRYLRYISAWMNAMKYCTCSQTWKISGIAASDAGFFGHLSLHPWDLCSH
jgi:hypothetical protein